MSLTTTANIGVISRSKDEWLNYLESTHPADIEMGLGRVTQVAQNLDLFKPAATVIVVGGTNGKGTTTALLGQLLAQKGLATACYNSPHINQYNERINRRDANGTARLTTDEELCTAFAAIEAGRGDIPLTYFEFGTLAALWQIKQWQVDIALLEVGLGGRLDAVNIVDTDLAIVTSVGLDHQDWLGDTLDLIGHEKAGIGRKDKPLICGQPNVSQGFIDYANELQANTLYQGIDFTIQQQADDLLLSFNKNLRCNSLDSADSNELVLPKGHIPHLNIASAIVGLHTLQLLPDLAGIRKAISDTKVAGRLTDYKCSYHGREITFTLDVAHNAQAAEYLAQQSRGCDTAVLAMLADKDPASVVFALQQINHWHIAGLSGYRGQSAEQLVAKLTDIQAQCHTTVATALHDILESERFQKGEITDPVFVIGSFLTVSAAENALKTMEGLTIHGND
jgi:dihydrofolate synthase/folylpolyglutamate synthase